MSKMGKTVEVDGVSASGLTEGGAEQALAALQVSVGARIRDVRTALKVGQAECARGAGIDKSSLFRIEKGDQNLTLDTLGRIALSLEVSMDELLIGVEPSYALLKPRSRR